MRASVCRVLQLLFAVAVCTPLPAGIGDIDTGFGEAGRLEAALLGVLPDGRLLVTRSDGYARTTPDGKPDLGFGVNGLQTWPSEFTPDTWVGWRESRVATSPDGSILVGGHIAEASSGRSIGALVRLLPDGAIDAGFGEQGIVRLPMPGQATPESRVHMPESVTFQPDGRILVLSFDYSDYWSETGTVHLQRFESDGRRDLAFGNNGEVKPAVDVSVVMGLLATRLQSLPDGGFKLGEDIYLDSLGRIQPPPSDSGNPDIALPGWFTVGHLPGGGSIVARHENPGYAGGVLRIARFDSTGRPVDTFGPQGTGQSAISETRNGMIFSTSVSPDGRFAYFATLWDGSTNFSILRVLLDGAGSGLPDPDFGEAGRVVMSAPVTGNHIVRIAGQRDGSSIVGGHGRVLRLSGTPGVGRGVIGPGTQRWEAQATHDRIQLVFTRTGGTDGAVGLRYETYSPAAAAPAIPGVVVAVAGTDYEARSGNIEWADGDGSDKTAFVTLKPGVQAQATRIFGVRLSEPTGGAVLSAYVVNVTIRPVLPAAPFAPAGSGQAAAGTAAPSSAGGGGAMGAVSLAMWLALLGLRRPAPCVATCCGTTRSGTASGRPSAR